MAKNQRVAIVSFQEHFNKIFKVFIQFGTIEPVLIALICWIIVIIGSLIHDFHRPPEFYLSDKRNIFNALFAKWCLAWTLAFLTPYMGLTYLVKSKYNLKSVSKKVLRLVVAVAIWFVVTTVLDWIENLTGECEGSDLYSKKKECFREGLVWNGIDISGHSFLLAYCTLIISEEVQVVRYWTNEKIYPNETIHANEKNSPNKKIISGERIQTIKQIYPNETFQSKQEFVSVRCICIVLYICCCLLMMLWVMLLVFTAVYFHTANSKILGIILALSAWILTYKVYFLSEYFAGAATRF